MWTCATGELHFRYSHRSGSIGNERVRPEPHKIGSCKLFHAKLFCEAMRPTKTIPIDACTSVAETLKASGLAETLMASWYARVYVRSHISEEGLHTD